MMALDDFRNRAGVFEDALVGAVAAIGPWLTPAPSAYFVGRAMVVHLQVWTPVAVVAALAIETIGITTATAAYAMWSYNRERARTRDAAAPTVLAVGMMGFYVFVTIVLTVALEVAPDLARFAPAIFPFLPVVGAVNLALRAGQRQRVEARRQRLAEARAKRRSKVEGQGSERPTSNDERSSNEQNVPSQPVERSHERDEQWQALAERLPVEFKRLDVERVTGLGKTTAVDLINYGRETDVLEIVRRGVYRFRNGTRTSADNLSGTRERELQMRMKLEGRDGDARHDHSNTGSGQALVGVVGGPEGVDAGGAGAPSDDGVRAALRGAAGAGSGAWGE